MKKRYKAYRLAGLVLSELLVSIFVFSLVSGICFYTAASAFRIFTNANSRQSLQRDAQAVASWLQHDLSTTNLMRAQQVQRDFSANRRDALAVVSMSSWQQPIATDTLSLPAWDRAVVYLTSLEEPGKLLRKSLLANGNPLPLQAPGIANILNDIVNEAFPNNQLENQRRLSNAVQSFSVEILPAYNSISIDLVLSEQTVQGGSGQARKETLEIHTAISPHNTWPRL